MILRPYQAAAVEQLRAQIRNRPCYVAPTGSGKTVVAAEIIRLARVPVLFVGHTREIVEQTVAKLGAQGIVPGVLMPGHKPDLENPVQVASVQTLGARMRRGADMPKAGLLFLDEAHHVRASTWMALLEHYADAFLIGMTATPCRLDGKGLGSVFGCLVETVTVTELVEQGHLATIQYMGGFVPDLSGIKVRGGDYAIDQLADAMRTKEINGSVVTHYLRHLDGKTALAFCVNIAHSISMRDRFREAGVTAEHVDGKTPRAERERIFQDLRERRVQVVTNCALVSEGYDCPSLDGVILARPTKSVALARQQVGRGMRPPGPVVVLDHAGIHKHHGHPEDPVRWDLTEDKAANVVEAKPYRMCRNCFAILPAGTGLCPFCQTDLSLEPETVDEIRAKLKEVTKKKKPTHTEKREAYRLLLAEAHDRQYKKGWASRRYRDQYGVWPTRVADLVDDELDACRGGACVFCRSVLAARREWAR